MARLQCHKNLGAFLDMIAHSELKSLVDEPEADEGYKIIVGSRPGKLILMENYDSHPHKLVKINEKLSSTAAGRYQLLYRFYEPYKTLLRLPDFSPESQDRIALQQIKECRAIELIMEGQMERGIDRCKHIWASFPAAGYGQHENSLTDLMAAYEKSGGTFA